MANDLMIVEDLRDLHMAEPAVVVIGKFDGVHIGHQAVLRTARARRDEVQRRSGGARTLLMAVTFDPLPSQFFRPEQELKLLTTPLERLWLTHRFGVDVGVCLHFNEDLAQRSSEDFIVLLKRHVNMVELVVGEDFALGRQRKGTVQVLHQLGQMHDFQVTTVGAVRNDKETVRSRDIRDLLRQGDVVRAHGHLGHPHFVAGRVITGGRQARHLGFPTANLAVNPVRCYPQVGVYATRTWIAGMSREAYASVTNLGFRPTFQGTEFRVETHLLDFPHPHQDGNLYHKTMAVFFVERLRAEMRFPSVEALCSQVALDIQEARAVLQANPSSATACFIQDLLCALQGADTPISRTSYS